MKTLEARYQQAHREARWAVFLALAYLIFWFVLGYGLAPDTEQHPELYLGLPLWFFTSCVLLPLIFIGLCAAMVRFIYQDMPLDLTAKESADES